MDLTKTNEHFVKLAKMILDTMPKYMRVLFKDRWNAKYPIQPWTNDTTSGQHLCSLITNARNQNQSKIHPSMEHMIRGGDVEEWDPTILFFVFLYANLNLIDACRPQDQRVKPLSMSENIDCFRVIRNTFFAHRPSMSVPDFEKISTDIKDIAKNVFGNVAENEIEEIAKSQITTPLSNQLEEQLERERAMNYKFTDWQRKMEEKMEALTQQVASIQRKMEGYGLSEKIEKIPDDLEHFVPRSAVLDKLRQGFISNKIVILHGMIGTGKTAVATKFANQQGMQYHNRIWVDMNEIYSIKKNEVDDIFRHILKSFYININDIKENDDVGYYLEATFRRLYKEKEQTLVILDNLDKFLEVKKEGDRSGVKELFISVVQTGRNWVHILGTSRCKADEQYFKGVKSIELTPFTLEESKEFLEPYLDNATQLSECLYESSYGYPLMLELFAKILSKADNKAEFVKRLKQIQEQPCKTVLVDSLYIKNCLIASLEILNEKEIQLAETLSFFGGLIQIDYAEELCKKVNTDFSCVYKLKDKGIIKSSNDGYAMHPFLKEIINERVSADEKLHFKASLVLVYIETLLKLSKYSFEKDKLASMVAELRQRMSSFNHLISILDSLTPDEMFMQEINILTQTGTFAELDPCVFFLLLRFLYYLVPRSHVKSIFKFLFESSSQKSTKDMLQACLDELDWNLQERQLFEDDLHKYKLVMYERRRLSERVTDIRNIASPKVASTREKDLKKKLNDLLKSIEDLPDKNIKEYYRVKVNKLFGNLALFRKHPAKAAEWFQNCCTICEAAFGASFLTIDSYDHLAKSRAKDRKSELAIEAFEKGMEIAQNAGLFSVSVTCTLFWSYAKFCLNEEGLKGRAKELLNTIMEVSYKQNEFNFYTKAYAAFCNNFPDSSQDMIRDIDKVEIPSKEFIWMVDEMFVFRLRITDRSTDRDEILRETRSGIDILKSGIAVARERLDSNRGDRAVIEEAIYNWNRNIAIYCPHVLLERERKQYAIEALSIPERNNSSEYSRKYLEMVRDAKHTEEDQKMILEVTFLEKTNKHMTACEKDVEQEKKILTVLQDCKESWLKLKLLTCQLELIVSRTDEDLALMTEIANFLHVDQLVQQRSAFTIYDAIQVMQKRKLTNEEIRQLIDICSNCIANLKKAPLKKGKEKKCSFQICQIGLLQQCGDCDKKYIASLMQEVLKFGKENKFGEVKAVRKQYEEYIEKQKQA